MQELPQLIEGDSSGSDSTARCLNISPLQYFMLGLKDLLSKDTLRERIETSSGIIKGEDGVPGQQKFAVVVKQTVPLHIAVEKIENWKNELEQMQEICETYKFDDKTAKELNMRILNSKFQLCVVKKTQTVIMKHPTGRNQFKVYGPIYNVENFVLTGNTKQAPKEQRASLQEQKVAIKEKAPQFLQIPKLALAHVDSKFLQNEASLFIIQEKQRNAHEIEYEISEQLMTVKIKLPCPERIIKEITASFEQFIKSINLSYQEKQIANEMALFMAKRLTGNFGVLENKFNVIIEELKSEEAVELIKNPDYYVSWSYEADSGEYMPYSEQHQIVIQDFYLEYRKAILLKSQSFDTGTTLPFLGSGYIYKVLIQNGKFVQYNPQTKKRRKMKRERVTQKPKLPQKKDNQVQWYFEGDTGFQVMTSPSTFETWFQKDTSQAFLYNVGQWMYKLEKRGDSFVQKNLKTNKQRRVIRKVQKVVAQYDTVEVPNYSTLVPIMRYRFEIKGRKDSLNQFNSYLLNEIATEVTKYGIEFTVPKQITLSQLKQFQLENLYVRIDQISLSSSERKVVLRGLKRLEVRNKFQNYIEKLMQMETKEGIEYPKQWTNIESLSYEKAKLVDLTQESKEFQMIEKHFLQTLPQDTVTKIQRIQSKRLWQKHALEKQDLKKRGRPTNEISLFHGTPTDISEILNSEEGLDLRFSNEGLWGRGVYFANKASYSKEYARKGDKYLKKQYYIFYCSVLRGDFINLSSDRSLTMPPKKDSTSSSRYDSVVGEASGSQITIVYSNSKAYPSYVIHFETES